MWILVVFALVVLLLALALARLSRRGGAASMDLPYARHEHLLSPAERNFLVALDEAAGAPYRIFVQVRAADTLRVTRNAGTSAFTSAFNRIRAKHFDFVVCDRDSTRIVCAVELDDSSHREPIRAARDRFLEDACRAAGLPLLRITARRDYDVDALRQQVLAATHDAHAMPPEPDLDVVMAEAPVMPKPSRAQDDAPACPHCGAAMVRRQVRTGANQGSELWGCSSFPRCRGIIPITGQARPV